MVVTEPVEKIPGENELMDKIEIVQVQEANSKAIESEDKVSCNLPTDVEGTNLEGLAKALLSNLSREKFWLDRHIYEDAENSYFTKKINAVVEIAPNTISDENFKAAEDIDDEKEKNEEIEMNIDNSISEKNLSEPEFKYNWTDESTYLSPRITLIQPKPISLSKPGTEFGISFASTALEIQVIVVHLIIRWYVIG